MSALHAAHVAGLFLAYVLACWLLYSRVARTVTEPYMDEPFHVGQTRAYCEGRWHEWDSKITTFPGLYVVAAAANFVPGMSCELPALRALNLLPAIATPCLLFVLTNQRFPNAPRSDQVMNALVLSLLPTHFFFNFLYYTDAFATCSVLVLLVLLHHGPSSKAFALAYHRAATTFAMASIVAIGFRQTNAVWVAFAFGCLLLRDLYLIAPCSKATSASLLPALAHCLSISLPVLQRQPSRMLTRYLPPLGVLVAFAAFVVYNGGIVVGDQANHKPVAHTAQLLYLTVLVSAPFHLEAFTIRLPATLKSAYAAAKGAPLTALSALFVSLLLAHGTHCHPFLLADNRHVTFYLWRHLLGRHWLIKYLLSPVYVLLGWESYRHLRLEVARGGALLGLGLLVCVALVLVPSPLIEPRYLTLPTFIIRLHIPPGGPRSWMPTLLLFLLMNAAMLALFLDRPYTWGDGSVARFMW